MTETSNNAELARRIQEALLAAGHTLVLAESCTAGQIAAALSAIPGASRVLAGSAVVYQIPTKIAWLHVAEATIEQADVVSGEVAREMAWGVLQQTPHATLALSITGHLGPDAPTDLDGVAWVALARRQNGRVTAQRLNLDRDTPNQSGRRPAESLRLRRQDAAVQQALELLLDELQPSHSAEETP